MEKSVFRQADRVAGKTLLEQGCVGHCLFSEGTYQIEIQGLDRKEVFWPFLQLDDKGRVLDRFCTCPLAEKEGSCPHLAAALLKIYNGKSDPLHVRFRDSFWNYLGKLCSGRHGYELSGLREEAPGFFKGISLTGKTLCSLRALTEGGRGKFHEIFFNRAVETEETSLKFSNLSVEEITLWKEGRPSRHLSYELSFWSDLAKWWMLLQEVETPYQIEFTYKEALLPRWMQVTLPDCELGFYLAEVDWAEFILPLSTVNSPLFVEEFSDQKIREIRYNPEERSFALELEESQEVGALKGGIEEGIPVGDWVYLPTKGFYTGRLDSYLQERKIPKEHIRGVLQKHPQLIHKHLVGTKMARDPLKARYELFFDKKKSLHVSCFLFEPGDLQRSLSAAFGDWVYLDGLGFYRLENLLFDALEQVVPRGKVADFVNRHRHWLQSYEGFQTHVSSVESHLAYKVTPEGCLVFEARVEFAEEGEEIIDFTDWIYVRGRGFYAKMGGRMGMALQPGMQVPPSELSRFLHFYKEELEPITRFFAPLSPLEKTGLRVVMNEAGRICVFPQNFFRPGYSAEKVRFFGDFTYVEGEGFALIAPEYRLPDTYQYERVIDKSSEPYFIAYELELLRPHVLEIDPRLAKPKTLFLRIARLRKSSVRTGGDWLAELEYVSEIGSVPAVEVWEALQEGKGYIFSDAGLLFLKPGRFGWLKGVGKKRWLKQGRQLRLSTMEWLRLAIVEDLQPPSQDEETGKLILQLEQFDTLLPLSLEGLKSDLRGYQEAGVKWLWFLFTHGLSGLLCDEMGLGKTHQAMGLLAAASNLEKKKYLVVCPTSVIYHWEGLLKRFLPNFRVRVFYGIQRRLDQFAEDADLLLTSYGTLRSERKALAKIKFDVAVFDEIQIAKNPRSQTHRALKMMDARMRLGLTGTPIENRLLELKTLFDLVLPGYFPSDHSFREFFINPIEKTEDSHKKALLSRLVRPFILRRKKKEVLLELPEKTEEIAYCDLSLEQEALYKQAFRAGKEQLLGQLADEKAPIPYVHVFSLLSQLKQICDHPCLVYKQIDRYQEHASGKWDLFVELLQETRESGQKLVVFSQYLLMLDIIKAHLKEHKIGFAEIRGSTRDRKGELERFKEDPHCEVFVASLQAAGVGIDLVAASVVIHYDRWWNPARENQATDRVHRMGQNRGVQVFKIVTKGTIEEDIHALIESKLALMEGVVGFDDQDQIKGLDRDELIQLLQQME